MLALRLPFFLKGAFLHLLPFSQLVLLLLELLSVRRVGDFYQLGVERRPTWQRICPLRSGEAGSSCARRDSPRRATLRHNSCAFSFCPPRRTPSERRGLELL